MKIFRFKTTIVNEMDVANVERILKEESMLSNWHVDIDHPEHILSVSGENLDPQLIENKLKQAGFATEMIQVLGAAGEGV